MLRLFRLMRHAPAGPDCHATEMPLVGETEICGELERLSQNYALAPSQTLPIKIGRSLADFRQVFIGRLRGGFLTAAKMAVEISESATRVGWVTHDVKEMTKSSSVIVEAVQMLSASFLQLSGQSDESVKEAIQVEQESASCVQRMQSVSEAMQHISERMTAIDAHVGVLDRAVKQIAEMAAIIEAISSQTNLLALNATIEAARAGEAGKGFGVVASEIKTLSTHTTYATAEIYKRLAVLKDEMDTIKIEADQSTAAVSDGRMTVTTAIGSIVSIGGRISSVRGSAQALADVIGHQRCATDEISERVTMIATNTKKVSNEVMATLSMLATAEHLAKRVLEGYGDLTIPGYELIRYSTDLAIWKRELASIFLGLAALPSEFPLPKMMPSDVSADKDIQAIINDFGEKSSLLSQHTIAFIHALRAEDVSKATRHYVTIEEEIEALRSLLGRLQ